GHARNAAEVDLRPEGDDEVLIGNDHPGRERARIDVHLLLLRIDMAHAPPQDPDAAAKPADRIDDVARGYGGARHLGQHGLEDEVVLVGDQDGLAGILARTLQLPADALATGHPGEAPAENGHFQFESGGSKIGCRHVRTNWSWKGLW